MVSNADSFSDGRVLFISLKQDYGKKRNKEHMGLNNDQTFLQMK